MVNTVTPGIQIYEQSNKDWWQPILLYEAYNAGQNITDWFLVYTNCPEEKV